MTGTAPRAVGVRKAYAEVPDRVRAWVDDVLGSPVRETFEQVGGMSPGCATRVVAADGTRAFVKAVGPELNPMTPELFRHETAVLSHLGRHDLWAGLLACYDEPDGWVALVLEDVPGRHVDTTDPDDEARLLAATDDLVAELAGAGAGLDIASTRQSIARWGEAWPEVATLPRGVLPDWVHEHAGALVERHERLLAVAEGDAVVQGDIRNDNVLVREDGDVVFVDWGMSRVGPAWFDPLAVRLEWVEDPRFDDLVRSSRVLAELGDDHVTALLTSLGVWLGYRTTVAVDVGLPTLNDFRRRESSRLLEGARRRLGV